MSLSIGFPNIPGLPAPASSALISGVGAALIGLTFGRAWGVFGQYGLPILLADNVVSVSHQDTSKVATMPLERGNFEAHNKVANPFTMSVMLSKGSGGPSMRDAFLMQLKYLAASTELFTIITPEAVYPNVVITGYDYERKAETNNALIRVMLHFQEVRTVQAQYIDVEQADTSNAQNPDAQNAVNTGQQQAQDAGANKSLLSQAAEMARDAVKQVKQYLLK